MKFTRFTGFLAVAMIVMLSCQKEISPEDFNPVDPPTVSDSIYIDRYYELEETAAGLDTMWGYYYKYDSLKRVVAVYYNEDFPTTSLDLELKYYYNGSDTIPYKKEDFDGAADMYPEETFFSFDSQKRIIRDSIRHYNNSGVLDLLTIVNYSYVPGKMYAHTTETGFFPPAPPTVDIEYDTAVLNAFGDILTHKKYNDVGGVSMLNNTSEFTYGTQAGPFARSTVFKAHHLLPIGETFIEETMTHKNLLTQYEADEDGSVSMDETFTGYQYNALGLVKEFRKGDAVPVRVRFFYRAL